MLVPVQKCKNIDCVQKYKNIQCAMLNLNVKGNKSKTCLTMVHMQEPECTIKIHVSREFKHAFTLAVHIVKQKWDRLI